MGIRDRAGFTLIELLIVVVIIGILAAIAIPKFTNTKEKSYVAAMKSDLRNLASAQESYYADENSYTTDQTLLEFNVSQQVKVNLDEGTARGWRATTEHANSSTVCVLYYGDASGGGAPKEGVISCRVP